jgi:hypothetical protein
MTTYTVTAGSDHLAKLSKATPVAALSELIWNSLDADAKQVKVVLVEGRLNQVEQLVVTDNGTGMPVDHAQSRFAQLGGSWKRRQGVSEGGRFLHGSEGRGRFKALAIGRIASWQITCDDLVELKTYRIEIRADAPNKIEIGEAKAAERDAQVGTTVRIEEVGSAVETFAGEGAIEDLTETFATYLVDYADVRVLVHGHQLDPAPLIANRVSLELEPAEIEGKVWSAKLDLIEWREHDRRTLFLANERGAPLQRTSRRFQVGNGKFTAYLRSEYISHLQESDSLEMAEMNEHVCRWLNQSQDVIKDYFDKQEAQESKSIIKKWQEDEVYPFKGEPSGIVETAERQVFDIVATHVVKHVDEYRSGSRESQALLLRLLRQAIERSPDDLQQILTEVLNLPKKEIKTLAGLLKDVSLSNVVNASAIVADRLKLIMGLQTIMFEDDFRKNLKERSQLHRILALNTWVFGDEWLLSADDRSLTQVLRAHRKVLGEDIQIDADVKHVSKSRGIVDLMFSKSSRHYGARSPSHLVVELKRPSVKIGPSEIDQILDYAQSVSQDARFEKTGCDWDFWLVGTQLTERAQYRLKDGMAQTSDDRVRVHVKVWAEILEENRGRLQFFKEQLDFEATEDKALSHLAERYSDLLQGVVEIEDETDQDHSEGSTADLR